MAMHGAGEEGVSHTWSRSSKMWDHFWIIFHTRGILQMEPWLLQQEGFCAGTIIAQNSSSSSVFMWWKLCLSCYKMISVKAKYHQGVELYQHSRSVVISICSESASVSTFLAAVTCSGLGLTASCHHHQYRQCCQCGEVTLWGTNIMEVRCNHLVA